MKLAFPTDDRKTIASKTGKCKEFALVVIDGDKVTYDYVENKHRHKHGQKNHDHNDIIEAVQSVDLFVVHRLGKPLQKELDNHNIAFVITKESEIEKLIQAEKIKLQSD